MSRTLATASSGCEPVSRISAGCRTDRGVIVTGVWSMDNGHSIRGGLNRNLGLKWGEKSTCGNFIKHGEQIGIRKKYNHR